MKTKYKMFCYVSNRTEKQNKFEIAMNKVYTFNTFKLIGRMEDNINIYISDVVIDRFTV